MLRCVLISFMKSDPQIRLQACRMIQQPQIFYSTRVRCPWNFFHLNILLIWMRIIIIVHAYSRNVECYVTAFTLYDLRYS